MSFGGQLKTKAYWARFISGTAGDDSHGTYLTKTQWWPGKTAKNAAKRLRRKRRAEK